ACPPDPLFVAGAELLRLFRPHGAVGDVDVLLGDVDVVEERLEDPPPVTLRVVRRHGEVFVEVDGDDAGEVEAGLVQADQLPVESDGRGPGRQAEDGGPAGVVVLADEAFDHQGDVPGRLGAGGKDQGWDPGVRDVMRRHDGVRGSVGEHEQLSLNTPHCTMAVAFWPPTTEAGTPAMMHVTLNGE